jgi:hypothetical protein
MRSQPMGALIPMPKGKPWTREEVKQLLDLREGGCKVSEIAGAMGKSEEAVMKKLQRIGLKVVQQSDSNSTTTSTVAFEIILPKELYSVEEALGMLAGAMKALQTPGLSKTEIMRLRNLIQAASVYQVKFAEYLDYRGTEKWLIELERKYRELVKREPVQNKPVETKQESIEPKQGPVEIKHESIEEQKPVESTRDNPVDVTQEDKNSIEEKGNENQP